MEDVMNTAYRPIAISDITSMLKRHIGKNVPPYKAEVLKYNNALVEEWYHSVLIKLANEKGQVKTRDAEFGLSVFVEGKEISSYREVQSHFPEIDQNHMKFWLDILKNEPVEKLRARGSFVVYQAFQLLLNYLRNKLAHRKWKKIYSRSADPLEWHRLALTYPFLFTETPLVSGLTNEQLEDIKDKVNTIMACPLEPLR